MFFFYYYIYFKIKTYIYLKIIVIIMRASVGKLISKAYCCYLQNFYQSFHAYLNRVELIICLILVNTLWGVNKV